MKLLRYISIAAFVIASSLIMAQSHNPRTSGQMIHDGAARVTGNLTVDGTLTGGSTTITALTGANGETWSNPIDGLISETYDDDAISLAIKSLASSNTAVEDNNVISRRFVAKDSGGVDTNYVMLDAYLRDVTDTTEDGELAIGFLSGGASKTLFIGSKAGGAQAILPGVTNEIDFGSASLEFKDGFFDGVVNIDAAVLDTAQVADLTNTRVVFAGASGELQDDADLTFSGATLTATNVNVTTLLRPSVLDGVVDLGTAGVNFRDLFIKSDITYPKSINLSSIGTASLAARSGADQVKLVEFALQSENAFGNLSDNDYLRLSARMGDDNGVAGPPWPVSVALDMVATDVSDSSFDSRLAVRYQSGSTTKTLTIGAAADGTHGVTNPGFYVATPETQAITGVGVAITPTAHMVYLNPDGNYDLTVDPQITDGVDGQILIVAVPTGEANTVTLDDGAGLQLSATHVLDALDTLMLRYDGTDWIEMSVTKGL